MYTRLHGFGGLNDRDGRDKIYKPYRSKKKDFYRSSEESLGNINDVRTMIAKDNIFIFILFYVGNRENPRRISHLSQFQNRI